jgi:hypothetical protein
LAVAGIFVSSVCLLMSSLLPMSVQSYAACMP